MSVHIVNPPGALDGGPASPVSAQVNVQTKKGGIQAMPVFYPGQSLRDAFFGQVLSGASACAFDQYMSALFEAEKAESDDEKQGHINCANSIVSAVVQFADRAAAQSTHLRQIRITNALDQLHQEQTGGNDRGRIIRPDGRQGD